MTVESSKTLAGIGSILLMIPILNIVGLIFVFMGMKELSYYYKEPKITQNALTGLIFGVIGIILSVAGAAFCVTLIGVIIGIPLIIVAFVFDLLMASRIKQALYVLSDRSGEHLFHTAGTLLWYGALLSIIFVGVFLIYLAYIILAVAFFTLKIAPNAPQYNSYTPPYQTTPPTNNANFCPNCGTSVVPEATFCAHCGK